MVRGFGGHFCFDFFRLRLLEPDEEPSVILLVEVGTDTVVEVEAVVAAAATGKMRVVGRGGGGGGGGGGGACAAAGVTAVAALLCSANCIG